MDKENPQNIPFDEGHPDVIQGNSTTKLATTILHLDSVSRRQWKILFFASQPLLMLRVLRTVYFVSPNLKNFTAQTLLHDTNGVVSFENSS